MNDLIKVPEFASWESTLKCNLRCKHCGLSAGHARENELNTKESKSMLERLVNFGVKHLIISGGEFSVRKDWKEILQFACNLDFKSIRVITNGHLGVNFVRIIEKMDNSEKVVISVSLDGTKKTHNKRRISGSFKKVISILKADTDISKTVITTVAKDNFSSLEQVLEICLNHEIDLWSVQIALPAGRMEKNMFLSLKQIKTLANAILKFQKLSGSKMVVMPDDCFGYLHSMRKKDWKGCPGGKKLITILSNGSITGCPTWTDEICGNIRLNSLKEVWKGEKMESLRQDIPNQCRSCNKCPGGCRAVEKIFNRQFCF